jgi:hypothetical protein
MAALAHRRHPKGRVGRHRARGDRRTLADRHLDGRRIGLRPADNLRLVRSDPALGRREWKNVRARFDDTTGITAGSVDANDWGAVWTLHSDHSGTNQQKIVRWNGWTQRVVKVYDWIPDNEQDLNDVAAITRRDVWIVGSRCPAYPTCRPLVMHWTGGSWRVAHTPLDHIRSAGLYGLAPVSPGELWTVGDHVLARYRAS